MKLLRGVNRVLVRTIGYELARPRSRGTGELPPPRAGDRLLDGPVFILSPVRSGSTLLRVLLDSHSQIHSPQEIHLRRISVQVKQGHPSKSLEELGLDEQRLQYLLWDRILHRELADSGKRILVNKTPNDLFILDRILECWPDARFIFLLRHPGAIARSRQKARPQDGRKKNARVVRRYCRALQRARRHHPGLTVRYEELTAEPERVTREICDWLGVDWEAGMLDYGRWSHGVYSPGLGDWSESIRSGAIRPSSPPPSEAETPPRLRRFARRWGYLSRKKGSAARGPQTAE
jgi:Sulfotransferase family